MEIVWFQKTYLNCNDCSKKIILNNFHIDAQIFEPSQDETYFMGCFYFCNSSPYAICLVPRLKGLCDNLTKWKLFRAASCTSHSCQQIGAELKSNLTGQQSASTTISIGVMFFQVSSKKETVASECEQRNVACDGLSQQDWPALEWASQKVITG